VGPAGPGDLSLGFTQFRAAAPGNGTGTEICRGTVVVQTGQRVFVQGTTLAVGGTSPYALPTLITFYITRNNMGVYASVLHSVPFTMLTEPLTSGPHEVMLMGWYGDYSMVSCHAFVLR